MSKIQDSTKQGVAIVLVPGSFCPPDFYTLVTQRLTKDGYKAVTECRLLSACPQDDQPTPLAKLEDDVRHIREVLQKHLSEGKDVVMMMNSYGGFPGTEALQGLPSRASLTKDASADSNGAIIGLIYLSSFLPLPGDSLRSVMGDYLFEPLKSGDPGNYMYLPAEGGPGIFNEWTVEGSARDEDVKKWFGRMITHTSDSFDGKITYDMWADDSFKAKVVYVVGELDLVVPPALADSMIEKVEGKAGSGKVEVTRVKDGGHVMHVTRPDDIVQVVESLLRDLSM